MGVIGLDVDKSSTLKKYRKTMADCIKLFIPNIRDGDIYPVIDYSINKRYKEEPCCITNSYTKKKSNSTLLHIVDYIADREPIVTAFGTMFKKHGVVPNPLAVVIQQFLDQRQYYKDEMIRCPKGSDDFEKFNLLQSLEKINANGELTSYAALA